MEIFVFLCVKFYEHLFSSGPLLEAVQMATIYEDSKTFVDKKLKFPPGKIIKNFETLLNQHNGSLLSVDEIKKVRITYHLIFLKKVHILSSWKMNQYIEGC